MSQSHAATIVDFDHISVPGFFVNLTSPYEEDGVRITNTATVTSLPIVSPTHPWSIGSPYLAAFDDPVNLVFTAVEVGMGISLDSIHAIEMSNPTPRTFTFYGTRFDDTIVSENIFTDGVVDIVKDNEAPDFHSFTTLAAEPFKSIAVSIGSVALGIDNIAFRLVSPTAAQVPEASTGVLAAALFGALLTLRHRAIAD